MIAGIGIGSEGDIVIIVIIDDCCFLCSRQRVWMLWMILRLIASKSTGVCFVGVVAVVMEGRVQCDVVLGSRDGVVERGSVIIIIGVEKSTTRIHLICRCQKGIFSMSAAMVQ